eukprot:1067381-Prorocentrum_minimum.AAC.1
MDMSGCDFMPPGGPRANQNQNQNQGRGPIKIKIKIIGAIGATRGTSRSAAGTTPQHTLHRTHARGAARTIRSASDHRIIGSSDHRIIGSSDHRII